MEWVATNLSYMRRKVLLGYTESQEKHDFRVFWLWKCFLRPQNVPEGPKCIFREVSSRLTNSRIFVKYWTFLGTACPHFVPSYLGKMAYFGPLGIGWKRLKKHVFQNLKPYSRLNVTLGPINVARHRLSVFLKFPNDIRRYSKVKMKKSIFFEKSIFLR